MKPDQAVIDYVKRTYDLGLSRYEIERRLKHAGHSKESIREAMRIVLAKEKPELQQKKKMKKKKGIKTEHLLYAILTLVIIMIVFISIISIMGMKKEFSETIPLGQEPGGCDDISETKEKDWCFFRQASQIKSVITCDSIEDKDIFEFCYSTILDDQFDCEKIIDESLRKQCMQGN